MAITKKTTAKKIVGKVKGKSVVEGKNGTLHYGPGTKGGTALTPKKAKTKIEDVVFEVPSFDDIESPNDSDIQESMLEDDIDINDLDVDLIDRSISETSVYKTPDGVIHNSDEIDIFDTSGFFQGELEEIAKLGTEDRKALVAKLAETARFGDSRHYFTQDGDYGLEDELTSYDSRSEAEDDDDEAVRYDREQASLGFSYN